MSEPPVLKASVITAIHAALEAYTRGKGKRVGRSRGYMVYNCPFHDDRTPSFQVNIGDGVGTCHGACRKAYSPQSIAEHFNIRLEYEGEEAARPEQRLALVNPRTASSDTGTQYAPPPVQYQAAALAVANECISNLWGEGGEVALQYLWARGLNDDTIRNAGLGYNPEMREVPPLRSSSNPENAAVLMPGIIIPHHSFDTLWALKVRSLDSEPRKKYTNLAGMNDNGSLYNGDAIKADLPIVICEGEFDTLIAQQTVGEIAACVTRCGVKYLASLSPQHVTLFKAAPCLILALDQDEAGDKACEEFKRLFPKAHRVTWADSKDITEYIVKGGDFRRLITEAIETVSQGGNGGADTVASEAMFLGLVIAYDETISVASRVGLEPQQFFRVAHRDLYTAMLNLETEGIPITPVAVEQRLDAMGKLEGFQVESMNAAQYIDNLAQRAQALNIYKEPMSYADSFARRIVEAAQRRALSAAYAQIGKVLGSARPVLDMLKDIDLIWDKAAQLSSPTLGDTYYVPDMVEPFLEKLKTESTSKGTRLRIGIDEIDNVLAIERGDIVVIGGGPSSGKSVLLQVMAMGYHSNHQTRMIFYALEMSWHQMMRRFTASLSHVAGTRLGAKDMADYEYAAAEKGANVLRQYDMYLVDKPVLSIGAIRRQCMALSRRRPFDVVFIDYLHLLDLEGNSDTDRLNTGMKALKWLARELNAVIVVASATSRPPDARPARQKFQMSDLYGSRFIEGFATAVVGLHRPVLFDPRGAPDLMEVYIAKNRNGAVGVFELKTDLPRYIIRSANEPPPDVEFQYVGDYIDS